MVELEEPLVQPAISKDFINFEFSLRGAATMLLDDDLFADGMQLQLWPQTESDEVG